MPELSSLVIKVDSREVRTAEKDLERLVKVGRTAQRELRSINLKVGIVGALPTRRQMEILGRQSKELRDKFRLIKIGVDSSKVLIATDRLIRLRDAAIAAERATRKIKVGVDSSEAAAAILAMRQMRAEGERQRRGAGGAAIGGAVAVRATGAAGTTDFRAAGEAARDASFGFDRMTQSVREYKQEQRSMRRGLVGTIRDLRVLGLAFGTYGIFAATSAISKITSEYAQLDGRLRVVARTNEEFVKSQTEVFEIAQRTSSRYAETAKLYVRVAAALKDTTTSQAEMLQFTEATNKAFQVSGASTAEAAGAVVQLSQALQSGVLRGQEFNSVNEQGGRLMQALADGLGVARGQLRGLAEAGILTTDVVFPALMSQVERLNYEFSLLPRTLVKAQTEFKNTFDELLSNADTTPLIGAIDDFTESLNDPATREGLILLTNNFIEFVSILVKGADAITVFLAKAARLSDVGARERLRAQALGGGADEVKVYVAQEISAAALQLKIYENRLNAIGDNEAFAKEAERLRESIRETEKKIEAAKGLIDVNKELTDEERKAKEIAEEENLERIRNEGIRAKAAAKTVSDIRELDAEIKLLATSELSLGDARKAASLEAEGRNADEIAAVLARIAIITKFKEARTAAEKAERDAAREAEKAIEDRRKAIEDESKALIERRAEYLLNNRALRDQITLIRQGVESELAANIVKNEAIGITRAETEVTQALNNELNTLKGIVDGFPEAYDSFGESIEEIDELIADLEDHIGDDFARSIEAAKVGFEDFDGPFRQSIDRMLDSLTTFDQASKKSGEERTQLQLKGFAQATSGFAGMFEEGSKAYEGLTLLANIAALANARQAVAAASTLPPPAGFIAGAAMFAAMASLGIQISGAFGGSGAGISGGALDTGAGIRSSGTVLGDPEASSESFLNALDSIESILDSGLNIDRQQLAALRNIEIALGSVSATFAQFSETTGVQSLSISGTAGSSQTQANTNFFLGGNDIAGIIDEITGGSFTTAAEAINDRVNRGIQTIFDNMGTSLGSAVDALGGDSAAAIDRFSDLDLGNRVIEEGEDIESAIAELFASIGDDAFSIVADQIGVDLRQFQQIGEGAAETLLRLSSEVQIFEDVSSVLGQQLNLTTSETLHAADALAQQAGGFDEFAENISNLFETILTDEQKLDRLESQLGDLFSGLDLELPTTQEGLAEVVGSLDLMTQSGREAFTAISEANDPLGDFIEQMDELRGKALEVKQAFGLALPDFDQFIRDTFQLGVNELPTTLSGMQDFINSLTEADQAALQPFISDLLSLVPAIDGAGNAVSSLTTRLQSQIISAQRQVATFGQTGSTLAFSNANFTLQDNLDEAGEDEAARAAAEALHALNMQLANMQLQAERAAAAAQAQAAAQQAAEQAAAELLQRQQRFAAFGQSIVDRINGFGLEGVEADLLALDVAFRSLREEAVEVGFDLSIIEDQFGRERLAIIERYNQELLDAELARLAELRDFTESFSERVAGFGLEGVEADLFDLENEFRSLREEAVEVGFDLNQIEDQFGRERLAIIEQYNQELLDAELARLTELREFTESFSERVAGFGLEGLDADLFDLENEFRSLREEAVEVGFDLNQIEDQFGRERLAIIEQYNQEILDAQQQSQIEALEEQISLLEQLRNAAESLRAFVRGELQGQNEAPGVALANAQREFFRLINAGRNGDLDAIGNVPGAGRSVIDAALREATTSAQFRVIRGTVLGASGALADSLDVQATELDVLQAQLIVLEEIRDAVDPNANSPVGSSGGGVTVGPGPGLSSGSGVTVGPFPGFANGGSFGGGVRMVGESGPELEFTGASRIFSTNDSQRMFNNMNRGVEVLLSRLINVTTDSNRMTAQTARSTRQVAKYVSRWDGNGLPEERDVAA